MAEHISLMYRLICSAENYDPEAIGKRILDALAKISRDWNI